MARLEAAAHEHGRRGQGQPLLGHVISGPVADLFGQLAALAAAQLDAENRLQTHAGQGGLDDQVIEIVQHIRA